MAANLQQIVQDRVSVLSEDELSKVLLFLRSLRKEKPASPTKPISEIFTELNSEISLDSWKDLPADGAENHDHYLYGAAKKIK